MTSKTSEGRTKAPRQHDTSPATVHVTLAIQIPLTEERTREDLRNLFGDDKRVWDRSWDGQHMTEQPTNHVAAFTRDGRDVEITSQGNVTRMPRRCEIAVTVYPKPDECDRIAAEEVWALLSKRTALMWGPFAPRLREASVKKVSERSFSGVLRGESSVLRALFRSPEFRIPVLLAMLAIAVIAVAAFLGSPSADRSYALLLTAAQAAAPGFVALVLTVVMRRSTPIHWTVT
jgi:hypothetical protein